VTSDDVWTERLILDRLRTYHNVNQWAFLEQVASSTGFDPRKIDAVAMGMHKSRGLNVHGFEVKISRGDWLRELRQPEKTLAVGKYLDFLWVVADGEVVKPADLAGLGWGWMVPTAYGVRIVKRAPRRTPEPLDRHFIAAIMRRLAAEQRR